MNVPKYYKNMLNIIIIIQVKNVNIGIHDISVKTLITGLHSANTMILWLYYRCYFRTNIDSHGIAFKFVPLFK